MLFCLSIAGASVRVCFLRSSPQFLRRWAVSGGKCGADVGHRQCCTGFLHQAHGCNVELTAAPWAMYAQAGPGWVFMDEAHARFKRKVRLCSCPYTHATVPAVNGTFSEYQQTHTQVRTHTHSNIWPADNGGTCTCQTNKHVCMVCAVRVRHQCDWGTPSAAGRVVQQCEHHLLQH